MKLLTRIAATLSSLFFLTAGLLVLVKVNPEAADALIGNVLGLVLLGIAFFVGPIVWLAGERWYPPQTGK